MIARASAIGLRGIAVFAGGTGGHLIPGLALCEHLRSTEPGCAVTLFRTMRKVEERILSGASIDVVPMEIDAPGAGLSGRWRFVRQVSRAVALVREHVRENEIDAIVGLGGYPSIPGVITARLEGRPLVLLEQNARPGKVTRYLGLLASAIACPDEASVRGFGIMSNVLSLRETGNPLRSVVSEARAWRESTPPDARRREVAADDRRVLLVVGGSQGAHAINGFLTRALSGGGRDELLRRLHVVHVTGTAERDEVERSYRASGVAARVVDYEPELPRLLAAADLVIARAGGTTISEVAAIGVPSVLVPYPGHRDRHQYENARTLTARGAAVTADESALTESFFDELIDLLFDDDRLSRMEQAARRGARTDGVERVTELIRSLVNDGDVR